MHGGHARSIFSVHFGGLQLYCVSVPSNPCHHSARDRCSSCELNIYWDRGTYTMMTVAPSQYHPHVSMWWCTSWMMWLRTSNWLAYSHEFRNWTVNGIAVGSNVCSFGTGRSLKKKWQLTKPQSTSNVATRSHVIDPSHVIHMYSHSQLRMWPHAVMWYVELFVDILFSTPNQ
jgi:hypothetical protein